MHTALLPHHHGAGLGLRLPHLAEVVATRPAIPFLEVHPESFLANPHATELLLQIAEWYPISIHTVGVSVGSASGVDRDHLARVTALVDRINPVLLSGHLAWSTHDGIYLNDLLPLPYTEETLATVASHIHQVQDAFGRPYILENPSSYVGFTNSTMTEPEFLAELVARTGCRLLCDVSNIHLSAHNMGFDARQYLRELPATAVAQFHLGGFELEDDEATPGGQVIIDTHGTVVDDAAWALYEFAVSHIGTRPTLIERDNDIPTLAGLLEESGRARHHADRGVRDGINRVLHGEAHAIAV